MKLFSVVQRPGYQALGEWNCEMVNLVGRQLHLQSMKVNKIDRPNTSPTVRGICTFAVYFSVLLPFCRFTLVYEGLFILCYHQAEGTEMPSFDFDTSLSKVP